MNAPSASQTAPVAEFRCLFTQDLRRKQKRWQDGYLKFHSFNSRIMVYDQARNFLGDTYHKDSAELHEGDELTLNNGALVEVAEGMGVTQTDLTPLFEKKTRESPARPNASAQTRPFQRPSSVAPSQVQRAASQLRHKSLNTLLGTSKGPVGKALPIQSPYDARYEKENGLVAARATKRQKTVQDTASWRASSPVQEETVAAKKDLPLWARTSAAKIARTPAKFAPPTASTIALGSEPDQQPPIFSDITLPSTPPKIVAAREQLRTNPTRVINPVTSVQPPPAQTIKIPRGKVPVSQVKALDTPKRPAPLSSPPVSASNRLTNVEFAVEPAVAPPKPPPPLTSPVRNPKAKSLRLTTGVKRGTLLCQSIPRQAPRQANASRLPGVQAKVRKTSCRPSKELSPNAPCTDRTHPQRHSPTVSRAKLPFEDNYQGSTLDVEVDSEKARTCEPPMLEKESLDSFDDPEFVHGFMDQQLLVPSSPAYPRNSCVPPNPAPDIFKRTASGVPNALPDVSGSYEPRLNDSRTIPKKNEISKSKSRKSVEKQPHIVTASLSSVPVLEPTILPRSRDVSPTRTDDSNTRSRASTTSPNKASLSTGGFRKKPKRTLKKSEKTISAADVRSVIARNETVPLPPHPLVVSKKSPLISTTELAARLQKPERMKKAIEDTIEYEARVMDKSPKRGFRRVRSENDAPIPSTAEVWEQRNLLKTSSNFTEMESESMTMAITTEPPKKRSTELSALIMKTDPRRKFKRSQSLCVDTKMPAVVEAELPSPVVDGDVGPWSTEAFDLLDWRPPNRE